MSKRKVSPKVAEEYSEDEGSVGSQDEMSSLASTSTESPITPKAPRKPAAKPVVNLGAPPKPRGRPKTKESYDVRAYNRKFREKAQPYYCEACGVYVSYFSRSRHLLTKKHERNCMA